jgi:SEC-C motif-containing protein
MGTLLERSVPARFFSGRKLAVCNKIAASVTIRSSEKVTMSESNPPRAQNENAPAGCPCGNEKSYEECCGLLHKGQPAPSAEALMRSRYTAFGMNLHDYIERSWHPSTRPKDLAAEANVSPKPRWVGLRIRRQDIIDDDHAVVEFQARYQLRGRMFTLHEISRFVREEGNWFYLDGKFPRR